MTLNLMLNSWLGWLVSLTDIFGTNSIKARCVELYKAK